MTVTDIDGNVYNAETFGTQVWITSNLKTTHYNDGQPIPFKMSASHWETN